MKTFVIEYHRKTGEIHFEQYTDRDAGGRRRIQLENERTNPDIEIASIYSNCESDLRKSHSRYFFAEDKFPWPARRYYPGSDEISESA